VVLIADLLKFIFSHYRLPEGLRFRRIKNSTLTEISFRLGKSFPKKPIILKHHKGTRCLLSSKDDDLISGSLNENTVIWSGKDSYKFKNILLDTYIRAMAELPNCDIAVGGLDHFIRIWSYEKQYKSIKYKLNGHTASVICFLVLPKGVLVSGSMDSTIGLWDVNTKNFIILKGHTSHVYGLALLKGDRFASASNDMTIRVWDECYKCIKVITGHDDAVKCVVESPRGDIVSGSGDTTIKIWNGKDYSLVTTLEGHQQSVHSLMLYPEGLLFSVSNQIIKIWDLFNGYRCILTFKAHNSYIYTLIRLPNNRFASCAQDDFIQIWDF
jgi:phospholipase A-2-activating protein